MSQAVQIPEDVWQRVRSAVRWVEEMRGQLSFPEPQNEFREPVLVKFTGTTGTSGAGSLQAYDGSTFSALGDPISVFTMNGEYLKQNSYYIAHQVDAEGEFVASPGAIRVGSYYGVHRLSFGTGFTVTETATGHTTVDYTETNRIIVDGNVTAILNTDDATGIYSYEDPLFTTTLKLAPAGIGAWGVVTDEGQEFEGTKTFAEQIFVRTNLGGSPAWMTGEWLQLNGGGAVMNGSGVTLVTTLTRTGGPYTHGGASHSGLSLSNGSVLIYRGFWDGFTNSYDPSYMIDLTLQGKYCVTYWDGAAWQGANGQTGTIGPGATCRGGIVVGGGSTGLTGTVP